MKFRNCSVVTEVEEPTSRWGLWRAKLVSGKRVLFRGDPFEWEGCLYITRQQAVVPLVVDPEKEAPALSRLKQARKALADEFGVKAFTIAYDAHLEELIEGWPKNMKQLKTVPHWTGVRGDKYGERFLAALNRQLELPLEEV